MSTLNNPSHKRVKEIFVVVGYFLALVISTLLFLLVVLLPGSTGVPAWIWIPLGISDVSLIIMQFRITPAWRGIAVGLIGMILVGLVAVLASQFFATTPQITDVEGNIIPGSIATLEKVNLNGSDQWITIRG